MLQMNLYLLFGFIAFEGKKIIQDMFVEQPGHEKVFLSHRG